jgi:hypothetical protein
MSAPPGYNESASMLPAGGGMIRAMQGGFSTSPYSGGVTELNSLLPAVRESNAPILSHHGGDGTSASPAASSEAMAAVAVAAPSAASSAAPAAASSTAPAAALSAEPSAALSAEPSAASSAAPSAALSAVPVQNSDNSYQVAAVAATAAHKLSSSVPIPVNELSNNNSVHNDNSTRGNTDENVNMSSVNENSTNQNKKGTKKKNETENEDETEKKMITLYGKEYEVGPPVDDEKWNKLMANIGLDGLPKDRQNKFREMIYEDPSCIEDDRAISASIKCEQTRNFIYEVAKELLNMPASNSSGKKIEITFKNENQVQKLSVDKIEVLSEPTGTTGPAEPAEVVKGPTGPVEPAEAVKGPTGPVESAQPVKPGKPAKGSAEPAKGPTGPTGTSEPAEPAKGPTGPTGTSEPAKGQTGTTQGGLRRKKRRTIRKQK